MDQTRRNFIRSSSLVALGMGAFPSFLSAAQMASQNDIVNMAVIGCNGMGWSNIHSHLQMNNVRCIALCDVDDSVLARRKEGYKKYRSNSITTYKDYRKLLENKDIDAVIIGTPDHWHCKIMVDALEAGKHIYVEKPLANSVEECYIMEAAARKYNKQVVQVGQWQRSGTHYAKAIDIVQSGQLGNIRLVKVWAYQGWMKPVAVQPDSAAPNGVDYKMWLGPAKTRAFNPNRFHFNFRWYWDYAGGLMTDWGVHEIDIALYAMKARAPKSVMASGGKLAYPDDASETPDTLQAVFEYDKFNMLWEHATGIDNGNYGRNEGIAFIGNNGTLVLNRGGFEVIVEDEQVEGKRKTFMSEIAPETTNGNYLDFHTQNFISAIAKNDPSFAKCPPSSGSTAAINAHMGNIAFKTGRKVYWNEAQKNFGNDTEANGLISTQYNNGWQKPKI
jgi:predicted dehydrogenase